MRFTRIEIHFETKDKEKQEVLILDQQGIQGILPSPSKPPRDKVPSSSRKPCPSWRASKRATGRGCARSSTARNSAGADHWSESGFEPCCHSERRPKAGGEESLSSRPGALDRDDCDSSPPPLRGSARNDS